MQGPTEINMGETDLDRRIIAAKASQAVIEQREAVASGAKRTTVEKAPPRAASQITMKPDDDGVRVTVGRLIVHERPDPGPMYYGHRAQVIDENGRQIVGERALYRLYEELQIIEAQAEEKSKKAAK